MRHGIWVVIAAGALLAGCSSSEAAAPVLTDDQLAHEYVQATSGKRLEDAANPGRARQLAVEMAGTNCDLMRRGEDAELMSRTPGDSRNADWVRAVEERFRRDAGSSDRSTVAALMVSAKYRCPEYTPMLELFESVYGS